MASVTVNPQGQIVLQPELLKPLGFEPGDTMELSLTPKGNLLSEANEPTGSIEDIFGCLAGKTTKVATLEEIQDTIERGWAGLL